MSFNDIAKTELVIFGCDGVLLDTSIVIYGAVASELRRYGLKRNISDMTRDFIGMTPTEIYNMVSQDLLAANCDPLDANFRTQIESDLDGFPTEAIHAITGAFSVLSSYDPSIVVAIDAAPNRVTKFLEHAGLLTLLEDRAFALGINSSAKQVRAAYLEVLQIFSLRPSQVLVADQYLMALAVARDLGMRTVAITGVGSQRAFRSRGFPCAMTVTDLQTKGLAAILA